MRVLDVDLVASVTRGKVDERLTSIRISSRAEIEDDILCRDFLLS